MKIINPYLNFNGNTEEAFRFYKSVFGGEFSMIMRYKDAPNSPKGNEEKIMHIALPIGNGQVLMGTDTCEGMEHTLKMGNNFYIFLGAESKEEARELFDKLSVGGSVQVAFDKMFWGDYMGQFADKFGVQWMTVFSENH